MNVVKFCILLIIAAVIAGCTKGAFFEKNNAITNHLWMYSDTQNFDLEISDTTKQYHLKVNVRHREIFPYKNLWVQILTTFPNGDSSEQLVNLPFADKEGNWYGKKTGDIVMQSVTIQPNALMPAKGNYQFAINQHMRMDSLEHIMDVGLRIEQLD